VPQCHHRADRLQYGRGNPHDQSAQALIERGRDRGESATAQREDRIEIARGEGDHSAMGIAQSRECIAPPSQRVAELPRLAALEK